MSRTPAKSVRASFTADEDTLLMKYIATYNPAKKDRSGNVLYKRLEANVDNKWNWSKTHPWQSWQYRYRKNMDEFDRRILKYQKKKGINTENQSGTEPIFPSSDEEAARDRSKETSKGKKRAGGQDGSEQRKVKRAKLERDQPDAGSSPSPLMKTNGTRQIPAVGPSDQARSSHPYQGPSETMPSPSPKQASTFNIPSLPSRSDTLPVPSSLPNYPVRTLPPISSQLPPSSQPLASSSQQVDTPKPPGPKRVLKHKSVSPIFGSLSPTCGRSTPLKTKILPKMVEGHFTTSLTDRLGHVRLGGRSEEKQTVTWPPVRGKKGKEKEVAQGPTASTSATAQERQHHPVNGSESQTSPPAAVPPKREPESQRPPAPLPLNGIESEHHPFSQVPFPPLPHPPRNPNGADEAESPLKHRSTNGVGHLVKNLWDRKRDNVMGSASVQPVAGPSKLTTAAGASGLISSAELPRGQPVVVPSATPTSKEKARLPNAPSLAQISTESTSSTIATVQQTGVPSKEEFAPILNAHSIVLPQERNSHSPGSAPHRSNMQPRPIPGSPFLPSNTDKGKGKQRNAKPPVTHAQRLLDRTQKRHRRKTVGGYDLPRMDLRTLSAVSTSRISRSRGSSSASRLPHRPSLPVHSTPSAIPADLSGYLITPGSAIPSVPLELITPVDLPLSASVGFRSLIARIAAAHGYSPDVVLEVYKRVESLQETEKCVRGMRDASESWIEAALEQREREARRARRASNGRENDRESRESDDSDDKPPRGSRHRPSLQQALPERRLPNGLRVRHEPGLYKPLPTKQTAPKKRASMVGDTSMGASWRAGAVGHYRTNQAEDEVADTAVDTGNEGGDDETTSGEEDEENSDDVKQAEEENVVEKLVSESSLEDLQDQDDPEYDAEDEPDLVPNDARQLDENGRHHDFSLREPPRAIRIKRESLTPPSLYGPHGDSGQNGKKVLNGALSDVRRTRSVSPPWNTDEDITPLSGNRRMHQMLERRLGKHGMKKRVVQLLR
ncbi:hypothetical protein BDR03DRAFT_949557 [Suillus americanus]|nr:hypothetical protein BDR03DRAFT_949557 [Suillus americanus]